MGSSTGRDDEVVYLDHAASSPLRPEVLEVMLPWFGERHANPTAAHRRGREARRALDDARAVLADALGFDRGEIVFTGGGTESDNLAVGRTHAPGTVLVGATEHPAVLEPARRQDAGIIGVNAIGVIDLDHLDRLLGVAVERGAPVELVSVMTVNNETGVVQPIGELVERVRLVCPEAVVHTDAVQALPWLELDRLLDGVDLVSVTAHKLGGPQGAGAIAVRSGREPDPLLVGGGQERDRRAGTQNVAGIVGFAEAVRLTVADREERLARIERLAETLLAGLAERIPGLAETVPGVARVPGIVHVCVPGVDSESLLFLLDEQNLACSAASSCASGAQGASHVLAAMGVDATGRAPLRLSLGWSTTDADIAAALEIIPRAVDVIRDRSGSGREAS